MIDGAAEATVRLDRARISVAVITGQFTWSAATGCKLDEYREVAKRRRRA